MARKKSKRQRAIEICKNLAGTILHMREITYSHTMEMFDDQYPRARKNKLERIRNNLIKKYGLSRRLL